jgi:hypothetical protein
MAEAVDLILEEMTGIFETLVQKANIYLPAFNEKIANVYLQFANLGHSSDVSVHGQRETIV